MPNVKRDKNNYRVFDDRDVDWIISLTCLKNCGMSIQDMKIYISYCLQGQSTIPERKVILDKQRDSLIEKMSKLKECVDYIDKKQQFYDDVLTGKTKYFSNLIQVED